MPSAYEGTDIISYLRGKYIIRQHRISYRASDISLNKLLAKADVQSQKNRRTNISIYRKAVWEYPQITDLFLQNSKGELAEMKLIKDIRLFELDVPNVDYNPSPYYIGKIYHYDRMDCLDVIQRLLFLLRHRGFCYDGFDHLYLNFTPCIPHGEIRDVNRHIIREFSWFREVDVGCNAEQFNGWTLAEQTAFILDAVKNASIMKAPEEMRQIFADAFDEVMEKGAALLLHYKRKENENYVVEILVHINDELDFLPLIRVTDKAGAVKAEQELRSYGRDEFITQISTITIGKSYVKIAPRKNYDTEYYGLKPIRIEW